MSVTEERTTEQRALDYRVAITRELVEHVENRTTGCHPEGPRYLPATEYTDPAVHERELAMLRRTPVVLCTSAEIRTPGAFQEADIGGTSVLVVRGHDGVVRAFLNACTHRGARLACGAGEFGKRIRCPYHAWNYDLDGRLRTISHPTHFGEVDKSVMGLVELPSEERHGLVFGRLDGSAPWDLDDFLGDFAPMLEGLGLDRMTHSPQHDVWHHPMNWKIALSTYMENYHFKFLHATTVGPAVHPDTSLVKTYGRHAINIIATANIGEFVGLGDEELRAKLARTGPFISIHFVFPNTIITAAANGPLVSSHVVQVYPGARSDEQRTDFRFIAVDPQDEETSAFLKMKAEVNAYAGEREDYETVQYTQASAATGLFPGLTFGANEALLTEAHRSWADAAGRGRPDRPPSAR